MKPLKPEQAHPIGHYRPLALLGEGAMGQVFLCLGQDGRVAAVKRIHPSFSRDDGFRVRFRHEVEASRRVSGAYTAAVMEADPEADAPWLASVYVAGPSLRDAVDAAGPLPPASMRRLIAGLAVALSDVHRAGLIHRDLKPGNVLLTSDGPRVIDFGIARAAEGTEFTSTGTVVGSPAYMSPEQAEGGDLTPASDMFSLGALLVMAATGQGPFTGSTAAQTLYNVVHEDPQVDGVPPEIRPAVEACLARDPAARPTPEQLLDMVGPVEGDGPMWPMPVQHLIDAQEAEVRHVLALPPPEPPPPPRKRRWPGVVGMVTATAAVVALSVVQGLTPTEGTAIEPQQREPVAQALSLDRLRTVDPCQLLNGQSLDGTKLQASSYSSYMHQCRYGEDEISTSSLTLDLGTAIDRSSASGTGDQIGGMPVLREQSSAGCQEFVALPSAPEQAISVEVFGAAEQGWCDELTTALNTTIDALRTDPPVRDLPDNSAALADTCSLLDDTAVSRAAGVLQSKTAEDLGSCRWEAIKGTGTVSTELAYGDSFGDNSHDDDVKPVKLGDVPAYVADRSGSTCRIEWKHRNFEGPESDTMSTIEVVRMTYSPRDNGNACKQLRRMATATAKEFPPAG